MDLMETHPPVETVSPRQQEVFGVTSADPDDEREAHPIAYRKLGYSVSAITHPSTFGETARSASQASEPLLDQIALDGI